MFDALAQPFVDPPQAAHPQVNNNQIEIEKPYPPATPQIPQQINNNQEPLLVDLFPDMTDDPLNDNHFLEAIQKIERENKQLNAQHTPLPPVVTSNNSVTFNYIQNVTRNVPTP